MGVIKGKIEIKSIPKELKNIYDESNVPDGHATITYEDFTIDPALVEGWTVLGEITEVYFVSGRICIIKTNSHVITKLEEAKGGLI